MDKNCNTPTVLTERQKFWLSHFRSCEAEDAQSRDYAKEHGLNINTFHTMRRRLRRLGIVVGPPQRCSPLFKKIPIHPKTNSFSEIRLCFPNGICLEFGKHFDETTLPTLLQTVAQIK